MRVSIDLPRRTAALRALTAATSSWLPAAVASIACIVLLHTVGTPRVVSTVYLAYLVVGVALPGTLLWRAARGPAVSFTEDVAVGSALGLAVQVVLAWAVAPLGWSGWAWLWGLPVVLATLVPALRPRVWSRPSPPSRPGAVVGAWLQAGVVVAAAAWLTTTSIGASAIAFLDGTGVTARAVPVQVYVDLPYHQSITAGIDQRFPLVYPYLFDEPLRYHLFVYEHLAAGANATGIDLTWIVYRLWILPLVALAIVLAGVVTRRLVDRPGAAPLGAVLVALSSAVSVYGWTGTPFQNPGLLHFAAFRSPTQMLGVTLFLACVAVLVALLRSGLRGHGPLVGVAALLMFAAGGSKATFLPILVCGLVAGTVVAAVWRGRWRAAAALTGLAVTAFATVLVAILGGQASDLAIRPFRTLAGFDLVRQVVPGASLSAHEGFVLALALVSWLAVGAGGLLLVRRYRDPALWLLLGAIAAGAGATVLTDASGQSQLYFLYSAFPLLGVLSAWGITSAIADHGWSRRAWLAVAGGLLVGLAVVRTVAATAGADRPPVVGPPGLPRVVLLAPWAALAVVAVAAGAVAWAGWRRRARGAGTGGAWGPRLPGGRGVAVLGAVLVLVGSGVSLRSGEVVDALQAVGGPIAPEGVVVPHDGAVAAVRVRDASDRDDVVATNAHCYPNQDGCDARHFWVSALTERRVLVEGWAYPGRPGATRTSPFWDAERYDLNEAAFDDPSAAVMARLRELGVRWLLVDRTVGVESPELARWATLVFDSDGAAVYEIRSAADTEDAADAADAEG